jgi:hypothetical protein
LGEDYLKLFREAQEAIGKSKNWEESKPVSAIKKRREEFAATRAQLRALLEVCEKDCVEKKEEELTEFILAILKFFQPELRSINPLKKSSGQELVEFFEDWKDFGYSEKFALEYLTSAVATLEAVWYETGGRYMAIKLKSLGS